MRHLQSNITTYGQPIPAFLYDKICVSARILPSLSIAIISANSIMISIWLNVVQVMYLRVQSFVSSMFWA